MKTAKLMLSLMCLILMSCAHEPKKSEAKNTEPQKVSFFKTKDGKPEQLLISIKDSDTLVIETPGLRLIREIHIDGLYDVAYSIAKTNQDGLLCLERENKKTEKKAKKIK